MQPRKNRLIRADRLPDAIMDAAPVNEMGVVCLFTDYARKHSIRIETIRTGYPDCVAWIKAGGKERQVRIEFEFASRNFRQHKHDPKRCDWIVCWEHNWADCPEHLTVIELRKEYGLGFNVWLQPVSNDTEAQYSTRLAKTRKHCRWSVASGAHEGDLVLFYHSTPRKEVADIFRIAGPLFMDGDGKGSFAWNSRTRDWFANLERVARLESPVALQHMKSHRALKDASWIRNNLVTRAQVTVDWMFVRELIVARNPELDAKLPQECGTMRTVRRSARGL
jgi:predicted RNA-binding protein with PUA-like domain